MSLVHLLKEAQAVSGIVEFDMNPLITDPNKIINTVENLYGLPEGTIVDSRRGKVCVEARMTAMYLSRFLTPFSFPELGDYFHKDHTTVLKNCKKIAKIVETGSNSRILDTILIVNKQFGDGDDHI